MVGYQLHQGDCREVLKELEPESVHCCITSPPYYGLRSYGTPPVVWGGDPACEHQWGVPVDKLGGGGQPGEKVRWQHVGEGPSGHPAANGGAFCGRCDAWKGDLGLEPTPEHHIRNLVEVFREVKRVLRKDGTLWLNYGDAYAGSWGNQGRKEERGTQRPINGPMMQNLSAGYPQKESNTGKCPPGLKPKDLIGLPWMLAFALRADGWWLRSDIIYAKKNPMPESVTDRPTRSHEYLFLLSKQAHYYYDADAIREEREGDGRLRGAIGGKQAGRNGNRLYSGRLVQDETLPAGRNKRSVWMIGTEPFSGAHFACYPTKLVEPCILAGCPVGGTVLDPFAGSGTTGEVAIAHGRRAVLIEMNPAYCELAKRRLLGTQPPLFALT